MNTEVLENPMNQYSQQMCMELKTQFVKRFALNLEEFNKVWDEYVAPNNG